jgi:ABC-2 type transport system permease protein
LAREHSPLKVLVISIFCVSWLAGLWYLFYASFRFLHALGGAGFFLIPQLFSLFFLGLAIMLVLSGAITSFSAIFQSRETRHLLTQPLTIREIMYYKFLESSLFSSWAFFFVIVPFIGAYASYRELSLVIALWTISFSVPFVMLCSGIGMLITLVMVRWIPFGRKLAIIGVGLAAAGILKLLVIGVDVQYSMTDGPLDLSKIIPGLEFSGNPLLPSWWIAEGVMSFTREQWGRGAMLWMVMTSSMLVLCLVIGKVGEFIFFSGYQRITGAVRIRKNTKPVLFQGLERIIPIGPGDLCAFVMKDLRIFLRDPAQWSQFLIFFGLLGLYFVNIRTFGYDEYSAEWRNLIAFLNLFSLSAVMCSLAARFTYPQLSMEGQGLWLVGLGPTTLPRVMMVKFFCAFISLLVVGEILTITSGLMLALQPLVLWNSIAVVLCISLSLSATATGLGAIFMDLDVKTPAKIISGFGGTLNLVLGLMGVLLSICPLAVIFHFNAIGMLSWEATRFYLFLAYVWLVLITVLMTAVPLSMGRRELLSRDF